METFDINGQQMTAEQVVDSYKKLQTDHTKVTQKNSEYSKNEEKVKSWTDFDKFIDESGLDRSAIGAGMDKLINDLKAGKAPTAANLEKLEKQIDDTDSKQIKAELEELRDTVLEREYEKTIVTFEKSAAKEGFEFKQKEFETFAYSWLKDLGIDDDGECTDSQLKKAYEAFESKKVKELSGKGKIPPLATSGAAGGVVKTEPTKGGGLKGAGQRVMEKLRS
jgi:hypothetical protein